MQILILAAGQGSRLGDLSADHPKSLVQMGTHPYLYHQLQTLRQCTDAEIVLVGGFCIAELEKFLDQYQFSHVKLVCNDQYKKGNLLSVLTAKPFLKDDFLILNADHCYSKETYQKILDLNKLDTVTICCDHDRELCHDDMKVSLDSEKHFEQMSKTLSSFDLGYVGVSFIPKRHHEYYWNMCAEALQKQGEGVHAEFVINLMAQSGAVIDICDISGSWWTEIDTPEDLQKARQVFLKQGFV